MNSRVLRAALLHLVLTLGLVALVLAAWAFRYQRASVGPELNWTSLRLSPTSLTLGPIHSVENGYAIFLEEVESKRETRRIHLYRLSDGQVATINPLDHVQDADEVNAYDVSVGKSGLLAVGANGTSYKSGGTTIVPLLLLFDTKGALVAGHVFPQKTAGPILRLAVDDDDAVWAVRRGREGADSAEPFLYKYTDSGRTETVVYTRARLPELGLIKPLVRQAGVPSLGLTKQSVFCWLPGIQEIVVMAKDGSDLRHYPVPVPQSAAATPDTQAMMVRVRMTETGIPLGDAKYLIPSNEPTLKPDRGIFQFDVKSGAWQRLKYDLPPTVELLGMDGDRPILGTKWKSWTEQDSSYQLFRPRQ
jgi:hypothetical protein